MATGTDYGHTRLLAEFVCNTRYEDLPPEVVTKAKLCTADIIGCMLLGSTRPQAAEVRKVVGALGGTPEATLVGTTQRTSCHYAALVNGLQASASRLLEDTHLESFAHPGVGVIPAVLAVGERVNASGRDLILATVLGYELVMRAAAAVTWKTICRGWHPRSGANVFGAAVAAAKLLGVDTVDGYCNAMGLAGLQASGLFEAGAPYDGWYLFSGTASQNGVLAGLLAARGFTAGSTILEGPRGFCQAFSPAPNLLRLTSRLGERFEILDIAQKRHASSSLTHPAIDAVLELQAEHSLRAEDVEAIDIETIDVFYLLDRHQPTSQMEGAHSLPYLAAVALTDGAVTDAQFTDEKFGDPFIHRLFDRIHVRASPEHTDRLPQCVSATVEVKTRQGKVFWKTRLYPRGDPRDPLTEAELYSKFIRLSGRVLGRARAAELWEKIQQLEEMKDVSVLVALLVG